MSFKYLLDKIENTPFQTYPYKHLEIRSFFAQAHFDELIKAPEIGFAPMASDEKLIDVLKEIGYEPVVFPGATESVEEYLEWHKAKAASNRNQVTCEGIGIVFRLKTPRSALLRDLNEFFDSEEYLACMAAKFGLNREAVYPDLGLQKYLDGYEISPHPDIRKKALTYMINVNPHPRSADLNYHTHYLEFVEPKRYVMEFWKGNPGADTCWVPWDWCRTIKRQTENNSLVMFSPAHDTIHAVRAQYDHLQTQRTQFYGNLWYSDVEPSFKPYFQDLEISATPRIRNDVAYKAWIQKHGQNQKRKRGQSIMARLISRIIANQ